MRTVNNVVESHTCEVSEYYVICVRTLLQTIESVQQRMVSVVLETGCKRTDIYKKIGFYHNFSCHNLIVRPAYVEQIKLHSLTQYLAKIAIFVTACDRIVCYMQLIAALLIFSLHSDIFIIMTQNTTSDTIIIIVLFFSFLITFSPAHLFRFINE